LVKTAAGLQGSDLTIAPPGSRCGQVPKKYGCAASVSNILLIKHQLTAREFACDVDALEHVLVSKKGATHVDQGDLKKGDIVIGREQRDGSHGRHVGIVDVDENGKLVVYNNHSGWFQKDSLQERFGNQYKHVYGLRLNIAEKNS
jgi:hypothetical protein